MGFDQDGKPDYETWLEMKEIKEGNHPDSELHNAVKRTVDFQYDWMKTNSSDDKY